MYQNVEVRSLKRRSKRITIDDLAKLAGVSKTTVSLVLNGKANSIGKETKKKIFKLAEELNYVPNSVARSLATKRTNTIGVILPDISNPFFAEMTKAIEDASNKLGYNIVLCNTENNTSKEDEYIKILLSRNTDGIVFIASGKGSNAVRLMESKALPYVLADRPIVSKEEHYGVFFKNFEGMKLAVEYLYSLGKKKIVFINGPKNLEVSHQRYLGYSQTMRKLGIFSKELVIESDFTLEGGMKATENLIRSKMKFDSIIYGNDIMAVGGLKVLIRNGIEVPKEVNVIGFDNIKYSEFVEPELTTIAQPIYEMGFTAAEMLIDIINGKKLLQKSVFFDPKLIVRKTTG